MFWTCIKIYFSLQAFFTGCFSPGPSNDRPVLPVRRYPAVCIDPLVQFAAFQYPHYLRRGELRPLLRGVAFVVQPVGYLLKL